MTDLLSLDNILKKFQAPLTEEQTWALCFCVLECYTNIKKTQGSKKVKFTNNLNNCYLNKDGHVDEATFLKKFKKVGTSIDEKAEDKTSEKAEDKTSEKAEDKTSEKAEEKTSEIAEEKTFKKAEEKTSEKAEEKASEKVEEKTSGKVEEKSSEKAEEKKKTKLKESDKEEMEVDDVAKNEDGSTESEEDKEEEEEADDNEKQEGHEVEDDQEEGEENSQEPEGDQTEEDDDVSKLKLSREMFELSNDVATQALNHFAEGKQHLLVNNITSAVNSLQEACGLLAKHYGETASECADAYYYYGRALLEMARIENGVLGNALDGVPEGSDAENSQIEDPENMTEGERDMVSEAVGEALEENFVENEKKKVCLVSSNVDAEVELSEIKSTVILNGNKSTEETEKMDIDEAEDKTSEKAEDKTSEKAEDKTSEKAEDKTSEKAEDKTSEKAEDKTIMKETSNHIDEKKKTKLKESDKEEMEVDAVAKNEDGSTESEEDKEEEDEADDNEKQEGDEVEDDQEEGEENSQEPEGDQTEEDDDVSNLELSWEMFELSKVIFSKQVPVNQKKLAQAYLKLGEVGLESENYAQSIEDFTSCLEIQKEALPSDDRCLAETHYQLGVAHSFSDDFDKAIDSFGAAAKVIESRISNLKDKIKEKESWTEEQKKKAVTQLEDPFYTEQGEIDELDKLLPEIKEKLVDMEEMKKVSKGKLQKVMVNDGEEDVAEAVSQAKKKITISELDSEKQIVINLGILLYRCLDYNLKEEDERILSPALDNLIQKMSAMEPDQRETDEVHDDYDADIKPQNCTLTMEEVFKICMDRLDYEGAALYYSKQILGIIKDFKLLITLDENKSQLQNKVTLWKKNPFETYLTPLEITSLMKDICLKRYKLRQVKFQNKVDDNKIGLCEFMVSRSLLKKVTDRKLPPPLKNDQSPVELLMLSIRNRANINLKHISPKAGPLSLPGKPCDVKATVLNSTSIKVTWSPPPERERNGAIWGYQIHMQELEPEGNKIAAKVIPPLDTHNTVTDHIVTDLVPNTRYQVQVAAINRKGGGERSAPHLVEMPGGVPNKPNVFIRDTTEYDGKLRVNVEWVPPTEPYGEIKGYQLKYSPKGEPMQTVTLEGGSMLHKTLADLHRGVEYEIRVSAKNHLDYGDQAITFYNTPEAPPPSGPPQNISYRFQSPGTIVFTWDSPKPTERNGNIIGYIVIFKKNVVLNNDYSHELSVTSCRIVFNGLEENMDYTFKVRAFSKEGMGPFSNILHLHTEPDKVRAPMNLKGIATSESSIEVWWEPVPARGKVIAYKIFYTTTALAYLERWHNIKVPVTHSAELKNLERHAQYAIRVGAVTQTGLGRISSPITVAVKPVDVPLNLRAHGVTTHSCNLTWKPPIQLNPVNFKITYSAFKEFVDVQGVTKVDSIKEVTNVVSKRTYSYILQELRPFTTYSINVTAVPSSNEYRPPAKITVTTQMAAGSKSPMISEKKAITSHSTPTNMPTIIITDEGVLSTIKKRKRTLRPIKSKPRVATFSPNISKQNKKRTFVNHWLRNPNYKSWLARGATKYEAVCTICEKTLTCHNSVLMNHMKTNLHKKLFNLNSTSTNKLCGQEAVDDVPELKHLNISFRENSLQEKIAMSSFPIIGLNRVEAFSRNQNGPWYYKCTTCGAHGNTDAMYFHLIGDKHTDRYIKMKVILKSSTITAEERTYIRSIISSKEAHTVNDIRIMIGKDFYPQIWEEDGKNGISQRRKTKSEKNKLVGACYQEELPLVGACEQEEPTLLKEEEDDDYEYFVKLIGLFAKMAQYFMPEDHNIESTDELRQALIVISTALHLIFFANEALLKEAEKTNENFVLFYSKQKEVVTNCLGFVEIRLKKRFNEKYPDIALD